MKRQRTSFNKFFFISAAVHTFLIVLIIYSVYLIGTGSEPYPIEIGMIENHGDSLNKSSSIKSQEKIRKEETRDKVNQKVNSARVSRKFADEKVQDKPVLKKLAKVNTTEKVQVKDTGSSTPTPKNPGTADISAKSSSLILAYPDYKFNPRPIYPNIARRRGYEGTVLLNVYVLKTGKVGELKLVKPSGFPVLDSSAIDSVKEWIFVPGSKNGVPVESWVQVPIEFKLKNI